MIRSQWLCSKRVQLIGKTVLAGVIMAFGSAIYTAAPNPAYADEASRNISDFVDLQFTVGSSDYYSKDGKKMLEVAPTLIDNNTMVPFRVLFEELGFTVEWLNDERAVRAVRGSTTMKISIGSEWAEVNGETKEMPAAAQILNDNTVIPLRFVSENSGSKVTWDQTTKKIYITRTGQYNTGEVLFYGKRGDTYKIYKYDGKALTPYPLENREVVDWYSYKGVVLINLFDKVKNTTSFVMFKDNEFKTLIDDFEMKERFEYNGNLIVHGYDRSQKINGLYRFDGQTLQLIEKDFYVGQHIEYNGKLLINRYNSNRDYSLVAFDKSSWTPKELTKGFIIKDYLDDGSTLYMTGAFQSGNEKPLAAYDGNSIEPASFKILHRNLNTSAAKIGMSYGKLYAVVDNNKLMRIESGGASEVSFANGNYRYNLTVTNIKAFQGNLYLAVSGARYYDLTSGKQISKPESPINPGIAELTDSLAVHTLVDQFDTKDMQIDKGYLLFRGTDRSTKDQVLYVMDRSLQISNTLDVQSIKRTIAMDNKLFVDVKDRDRITGKDRNTMLIYTPGGGIKNLVLGMQTKNWSVLGDTLYFSGLEEGIRKEKVYSYTNEFNEQIANMEVKYWGLLQDKLFVSGTNPESKKSAMYKFTGGVKEFVREDVEVSDMIKVSGPYYFVVLTPRDAQSPVNGQKLLFLYDDVQRSFVEKFYFNEEVAPGDKTKKVEVMKMIFIQ